MPEGSTLASSSSPWNYPQPPPPPSPLDPWFLHSSHLDNQILSHALIRELGSSTSKPLEHSSASSPDSLAHTLSHCISATADHTPSSVLRALQQAAGGVFLQQRQPNLSSNTASPSMSSSDFRSQPGSPFNSSCANSNTSLGDSMGCKPQLSMEAREVLESEGANKMLGSFGLGAAPVKLEESFGGNGLASSAVPSSRPPAALSAQAGVGAATTKVGKRRSRATNKPPITVLSADASNFRAMVQKLTGIPASPTLQRNSLHLWSTPSGTVSLMKPNPTRPNQSIQGLPTLDTSAYLLLDGGSTLTQTPRFLQSDNFLQSLPFLQPSQSQPDASFNANLVGELGWNRGGGQFHQASLPSGTNPDLKSLLPNLLDPFKLGNPNNPNTSSCISMPMLWDGHNNDKLREKCYSDRLRDGCFTDRLEDGFNGRGDNSFDKNSRQVLPQGIIGGVEAEQLNTRPGANLESLLMGSDFDFAGRTLHTVDSWLSYDGALGIHTPKMELAHSA